jgi:hypothetical protein
MVWTFSPGGCHLLAILQHSPRIWGPQDGLLWEWLVPYLDCNRYDLILPPHLSVIWSFDPSAELGDYKSASQRHYQRVLTKQREDQVAYLKGLAAHAWNWVASAFYSTLPNPTSSESITSQRSKQLWRGASPVLVGAQVKESLLVYYHSNAYGLLEPLPWPPSLSRPCTPSFSCNILGFRIFEPSWHPFLTAFPPYHLSILDLYSSEFMVN